ncbi:MAG: esterase/lipase family protein [Stenomitos frigidus ULC029]
MSRKTLLTNTVCEQNGSSNELVVLLHGYTHTSRSLGDVRSAVKASLSHADLLVPDYPAGLFASTNPTRVADQLVQYIDDAVSKRARRPDGRQYDRILFVGHSAGALLIRKVYVIAMGYDSDNAVRGKTSPRTWATKVDRLILMAGINRGISLDTRPEDMNWVKFQAQRLGYIILTFTNTGKFIRSLRRGSPFVTNLRIQWIRLSQGSAVQLPQTIQLLGDVDDLVSEEDNIDVATDYNFKYLEVRDTGHGSIVRFQEPEIGAYRQERFQYALVTPFEAIEGNVILNAMVDLSKDQIIFIMHGIRDTGLWTNAVRQAIEAQKKTAYVSVAGYGYFPMLRFLLLGARQTNVRWFMDEYTEAIARYPKAALSYIGHSNGTYLIASALERYSACTMDRIAFAGSVVRSDYDWDSLVHQGRVQSIRNDVASADWIVGIFPGFFELLRFSDLGTAGHNGFADHEGKKNTVAYFKGGHGAALQPQNYASLARFALTGEVVQEDGLLVKQQSTVVALVAKLCWAIWAAIAIALLLLGVATVSLLALLSVPVGISWLLYACLVLLLLYTL